MQCSTRSRVSRQSTGAYLNCIISYQSLLVLYFCTGEDSQTVPLTIEPTASSVSSKDDSKPPAQKNTEGRTSSTTEPILRRSTRPRGATRTSYSELHIDNEGNEARKVSQAGKKKPSREGKSTERNLRQPTEPNVSTLSLKPPPMSSETSEEKWPAQTTWDKLATELTPHDLRKAKAIFDNDDLSDSLKLLHLSQLLPSPQEDDDIQIHPLMLQLLSTHTATYIIIIWIRTSPDEILIEIIETNSKRRKVELNCLSQQKRSLACFLHLERTSSKGSVILCPIMIVAEGVKGRETLESDPFDALKSVVKSVRGACSTSKQIVVAPTEENRLNRIPADAFKMVSELNKFGADVKYWKSWHAAGSNELNRAFEENVAELERIRQFRTTNDCAKGLRNSQLYKDQFMPLQRAVQDLVPSMEEKITNFVSADPLGVKEAVCKGNTQLNELLALYSEESER